MNQTSQSYDLLGFLDELNGINKEALFKDFLTAVKGTGARRTAQAFEKRIMSNPIVQRGVRRAKKVHSAPIHRDYVRDYLGGKLDTKYFLPTELLGKGRGREKLFDLLEGGREAVKAERLRTLKARLGLGGGVALTAAVPTAAYAIKKAESEESSLLPAAAGVGVGTLPFIQGFRSKALGSLNRDIPKTFKNVRELNKAIMPGDIILSGKAGVGDPIKAAITAIGGDPKGYHAEVALGRDKPGAPHSGVHSHPAFGGAAPEKLRWTGQNVVVMRYRKDPKGLKAKKLMDALRKRVDLQSALEHTFGGAAGRSRYDEARSIRAGVASILPKPIGDLFLTKTPSAGTAVCSSLVGQCSPVNLSPGTKPEDILPHHIRRSRELKAVGKLVPKMSLGGRMAETAMAASPWLIRGGLGLGLGYGAYRAAKALSDR